MTIEDIADPVLIGAPRSVAESVIIIIIIIIIIFIPHVLLLLLLLFFYYHYYNVFEVFKIKSSVKSTYATLKLELQLDFQHGQRQPSLIRPQRET